MSEGEKREALIVLSDFEIIPRAHTNCSKSTRHAAGTHQQHIWENMRILMQSTRGATLQDLPWMCAVSQRKGAAALCEQFGGLEITACRSSQLAKSNLGMLI
eukprot:gnl/TRDRNA2_/TRDRNA2_207147_c0_seq1.p1 gnl/TRDRNA2_/TRDRNA2_207147_c0~~gnl/TRDRNA2_/TRDRNA2_207147_c0_seq1.p1  ORF type:complete len:102 (-),score=13.26 gnl/TRDRNA2_/TRDRNA2_207147_c0_seq1:31-336(-)